MKQHLINSPFDGFDWQTLDLPGFGEDAVREELIAPLLRILSYKVSGTDKIIRSHRLKHPFVMLGTTKHKLSLVPDYLLYAHDRPAWILDAKSPVESVIDAAHEQQAYSYAIHPDVRVNWYAVCNGKEFAAFNVGDVGQQPRLRFQLQDLRSAWSDLWQLLSPEPFCKPEEDAYLKDFGIHLTKMGVDPDLSVDLPSVPVCLVGWAYDDVFTMGCVVQVDGNSYSVSFDFDRALVDDLLALLPSSIGDAVRAGVIPRIAPIRIGPDFPYVGLTCRLGHRWEENDKEHYRPLEVLAFRAGIQQ